MYFEHTFPFNWNEMLYRSSIQDEQNWWACTKYTHWTAFVWNTINSLNVLFFYYFRRIYSVFCAFVVTDSNRLFARISLCFHTWTPKPKNTISLISSDQVSIQQKRFIELWHAQSTYNAKNFSTQLAILLMLSMFASTNDALMS